MKTEEIKPPTSPIIKNHIWIIIDGNDDRSYYHGLAVAFYVTKDPRIESANFKINIVGTDDIFTSSFKECYNSEIPEFAGKQIIKNSFRKNLNAGDILIAAGGTKLINAISYISSHHPEVFCYFGATKNITFVKDHFNANLFSIFSTSLKKKDFDDDNIVPINPDSTFVYNFKTQKELSVKPEMSYIFVVLPHLTDKKKNEIYRAFNFDDKSILSFGFLNLIEAIKLCYTLDKKIVIISDLKEEEDYDIEFAIKGLLSKGLASRIKIKFLYQNYVSSHVIPTASEHLNINVNDKIILSSDDTCNILNLMKHGVRSDNILHFKHFLEKESPIFKKPFGILLEDEVLQIKKLIHFNEDDLALLKPNHSKITNIAHYIAFTLVTLYTEDPQFKDPTEKEATEVHESEEEIEEKEVKIEEEDPEIQQEMDDEIKEELDPELDIQNEVVKESKVINPEVKLEETDDLKEEGSIFQETPNQDEKDPHDVSLDDIKDEEYIDELPNSEIDITPEDLTQNTIEAQNENQEKQDTKKQDTPEEPMNHQERLENKRNNTNNDISLGD